MCISSEMGLRSVYLEAASKIENCKILHESTKIEEEAIEWLRTQNDLDGLGAMIVLQGKYHKYLVTALDYLNKGECCDNVRLSKYDPRYLW